LFLAGTGNFAYWAITDESPPLIIRDAHLINPVVEQGGQIRYVAVYDKRTDCSPLLGEGNVHYKYEAMSPVVDPNQGKVIRDKVAGTISDSWPAGKNLKGEGYVAVPDDLPEGTYELSAVAVYNCSKAPSRLKAKTPTMTLQVVARKATAPIASNSAPPAVPAAAPARVPNERIANTSTHPKRQP
jgi:hypothetical protein